MNIQLYQINLDRDLDRVAFEPYGGLVSQRLGEPIDSSIYDRTFSGEVDADNLEKIYEIFNLNHPEGFKGRSMSVSDVVEVVSDGETEPGFYFCDSIGFRKIDFDPELTEIPKEANITVVMVKPGELAKTMEIGNALEDLQKAVGGDIEAFYPFEEEVCIVCNEEGKFNGMAPNRAVYGEDKQIMDIIFGPFFICDCSGENFGSLSKEQLEKYSKQFKYPEHFLRNDRDVIAIPYKPEKFKER